MAIKCEIQYDIIVRLGACDKHGTGTWEKGGRAVHREVAPWKLLRTGTAMVHCEDSICVADKIGANRSARSLYDKSVN